MAALGGVAAVALALAVREPARETVPVMVPSVGPARFAGAVPALSGGARAVHARQFLEHVPAAARP